MWLWPCKFHLLKIQAVYNACTFSRGFYYIHIVSIWLFPGSVCLVTILHHPLPQISIFRYLIKWVSLSFAWSWARQLGVGTCSEQAAEQSPFFASCLSAWVRPAIRVIFGGSNLQWESVMCSVSWYSLHCVQTPDSQLLVSVLLCFSPLLPSLFYLL